MREILFRGFTPDERGKTKIIVDGKSIKGHWVQGSYWKLQKTTYCFKEDYDAHPDNTEHYIVFSQMVDWGLPNRQLQADVLPETVGQYTGLTDKNGKKIFEGDIVNIEYPDAVICNTVINYIGAGFFGSKFDDDWELDGYVSLEVIGNIHDNPELLSEGE